MKYRDTKTGEVVEILMMTPYGWAEHTILLSDGRDVFEDFFHARFEPVGDE